jgi:tetratricopeptide (TPR) repeat protein
VASFSDRKAKVAVDYLLAGVKNYQVNGDEDYLRRNGKYYFKSIFYLGKCYHVLRDYGKARRCFEKVLADDTRHYVEEVYVRYNLARTELESGNSEAARKLAIEALQLQEKHPDAWLVDFLGRVYFSQQRYDQAIEQYNRAIKLRAQSYILFNRARAWYRKGDTARAIEDLNAALQRDRKGKHKTLLELGKIVLEQGKLEDARVYFERAIEFKRKIYDSDYAEAHLALAEYYRKTGDEAHAAQEVKTAESLRPELEFDDQLLKSTRIIL